MFKGVPIATTLPVKFLSFNAAYSSKKVKIAWATTDEINNKYFILERSKDGQSFGSLYEVPATNIQTVNSYNYTDESPLNGVSYYRLKSVDNDGRFMYSNIVTVNAQGAELVTVYPNPATSVLKAIFPATNKAAVISVLDINGKKLASYPLAEGSTQTTINVAGLAPGNYILLLNNVDKQTTAMFIKAAN